MPDLGPLDTLIALVVVLLTLSLVVQAIQSALKKLLKIKSRQLEESLVDLFETVLDPTEKKASKRSRVATLSALPGVKYPSEWANPKVKSLFDAVMKEFSEIGRVSTAGKRMLDSISKEDLMKVLNKVGPDTLRPNVMTNLQTACGEFVKLRDALKAVQADRLTGASSAKFAKLREAFAPLLNDMQCFLKSEAGSEVFNPNLLLADILNLREVKAGDLLDLLGELQATVAADLKATPGDVVLEKLDADLRAVATSFTALHQKIDEAVAPLRVKLKEIEDWYDTVMQSFEERYNRGMKTYTFVISLVVAVWLNASIFTIYQNVATNDTLRATIVSNGEARLVQYRQMLAVPETAADPAKADSLRKLIETESKEIEKRAAEYAAFGFKSLKEELKELKDTSTQAHARHVAMQMLGWLITAALLTVGAPFWYDLLDSLFGIKNLLRKRGDIKNVETEAGAGQPRT
jgi:hypothetical protein